MLQQGIFPAGVAEVRRPAALDAIAVAGALVVGAWARVPLPFSPVPLTLQTLPVLMAAFAVGRNRATAGMLLYVGLGLAGVPLFAASFGPTFGYLLGFVAAPAVASRFARPAAGMAVAMLAIYAFGVAWLSLWMAWSPWLAFLTGVVPFLPGDLLKLAVACRLVSWMRA